MALAYSFQMLSWENYGIIYRLNEQCFTGNEEGRWFHEGNSFINMNNLINTKGTNLFSPSPSGATELLLNIFQSFFIKGAK